MPLPPAGSPQTLVQYRLEVRRLLHDATGKFWSDSELNDYINTGRFATASVTGCVRSLVVGALSTGLEKYPIGGVVGGVVNASGAGYSTLTVTVLGDGTGALAHATLLPATTPTVGGTVQALTVHGGAFFTTKPTLSFAGDGSGAAGDIYLSISPEAVFVVAVAGTGYKAGQLLTQVGGTFVVPATYRVVSTGGGGTVTAIVLENPGQYTVLPAVGNLALTGGTGVGATVQSPVWGVGPAFVTNPGSGYTFCAVTIVGGGGGIDASVAAVLGPITGGNGLAQIVIDDPGAGYTFATLQLSGNGAGALATATVLPYNTLDIMNITPIFGGQRIPLNYMPWTEFNAKARVLTINPQLPRVWSRYGTSGGAAFMQPVPDQPYPAEFDTAVLPATLASDTQVDVLQYPYTQPVAYYAAWKAKEKQQAYSEGEEYLKQFKAHVLTAQASVQMRRIPNPYAGYTGG